mgnify:CR=1 FL=1|jgi:hypothetical protein
MYMDRVQSNKLIFLIEYRLNFFIDKELNSIIGLIFLICALVE